MIISFLNKKVLISTFFYGCFLLPVISSFTHQERVYASTTHGDCPDSSYKNTTSNVKSAIVHHIIDGDTLVLTDGKKIRLLGINTPEVNLKKPQQSQPLGISARSRLQELIPDGSEVTLIFDQRKKDRYKRLLAFVRYRNKHGVEIDTGEVLLKEGLAWQYLILPNQLCWENYRHAESIAYNRQSGVWDKQNYQIEKASTVVLSDKKRLYKRLSGTVTGLDHSSKNYWFIVDDRIWFGIARKDAHYFGGEIESIKQGTRLLLSGWMYQSYNKLRIKARHPQAIRIFQE